MKNLNEEKLRFILSGKDGNLSKDIDKIIKKEQLENTNNKEDKPV